MNRSQVIERLEACADDPMWADHSEVSKKTLREAVRHLRDRITDEQIESGVKAFIHAVPDGHFKRLAAFRAAFDALEGGKP
jgi:hypothetical protein